MIGVTWIVVVNGSEGKIYERRRPASALKLIPDGEFVGDKRPSREINTDRNGRKPHSVNMSTAESVDDPQTVAKRRYLHGIAQFLDKARVGQRFHRLILIAPPQILGLLRNELSHPLMDRIDLEINKDLTRESALSVMERLQAPARQHEEELRRLKDERRLRGA